MDFLAEVRAKRQKLADVLFDEEYSGIRKIVEDLYPDRAHFIYELLQNAEDAGATEAFFDLTDSSVVFEHNGRPFDQSDIWGITNIGKGTKEHQEETIGRFGIGFKAVFVYSETPYIWSKTYSFMISNLVLPTSIAQKSELGRNTRFEFPFNNPKKSAQLAYNEIKTGLEGLTGTTLLFLSNLKSIHWRIAHELSGSVQRVRHKHGHIEVIKQLGEKTTESLHFLRFSAAVEGLPKQSVSIAYALDYPPTISKFAPEKPIAQQLKIVPSPGSVSIYFPAEKETSGLRFHLHAPFVPELSRASVKTTPANLPLFNQLASLAAQSLYRIRDLGLLNGEFLAVLPNLHDAIPEAYQPIRTAIIEAMNNEPLTPTHSRSYAPARVLLQARASLKELLCQNDLSFLIAAKEQPEWAIAATQRNSNQDRFLNGLAITDWDVGRFVTLLSRLSTDEKARPNLTKWLATKPAEWHQQMYALLFDYYKDLRVEYQQYQFKSLCIVRLSNGNYSTGADCYFPSDGMEDDPLLPRVAKDIYTSGKSTPQQTLARKLLEAIGVREVGEAEQIESILKQRYTAKKIHPELHDLQRFIALIENDPTQASLFSRYFIFKLASNKWEKPSQVFLDSPYLNTDLSAYYDALDQDDKKWALSEQYQTIGISNNRLCKFATAVGVHTAIEVKHKSVYDHPQRSALTIDYAGYRVRRTDSEINDDWDIPHLQQLLTKPAQKLSRLLWKTLCNAPEKVLQARFRPNQQYQTQTAPSSLVLLLTKSAWVPQKNGVFVTPQEASPTQLPEGFPIDKGYAWLSAVHFGEREQQESEAHKSKLAVAKDLGFSDPESLREAQWFAKLTPDERKRIRDGYEQARQFELPEENTKNPERRAKHVGQQALTAPERATEVRSRSVSVGRDDVKQQTDQYLRQQYTNADGAMICQICKAPLPFKLDDGSYYVEKVEFLPELHKHHYQNYLALCPNHGAMFQFANGSRAIAREMFINMIANELEVLLAQQATTIYFTKTHVVDLRIVLEVDKQQNQCNEVA